jgi:hypothetical protein
MNTNHHVLSASKAVELVAGLIPFPKVIRNSFGERVLSREIIRNNGSQTKEGRRSTDDHQQRTVNIGVATKGNVCSSSRRTENQSSVERQEKVSVECEGS